MALRRRHALVFDLVDVPAWCRRGCGEREFAVVWESLVRRPGVGSASVGVGGAVFLFGVGAVVG